MRVLLDQGLSHSAAKLLRELNIEALHVSELGMSAAKDSDIIDFAQADARIVITLDADFHSLLAHRKATMPSVIRIRIEGLKAPELTQLVLDVFTHCKDDLERGCAITVQPDKIRVRLLPLTSGV